MATGSVTVADIPLLRYLLRRADDALILGHRISEWCGHAPIMEEEMALANMGLDLIGQARSLYGYAAEVEGAGNDENSYAYLRDERGYLNLLRQYLYSAFIHPYWSALMGSADPTLAAIAAKAEKEAAYHVRHCAEWVIRLGDGTAESHRRIAEALIRLWPFTGEMFEVDAGERGLIEAGLIPDPARLREGWRHDVAAILNRATLEMPADGWMQQGGRDGRHTEAFGHLLSELQYVQRAYPGATW